MDGTTMKKSLLILMRHAKSDWPQNLRRDFDRPLAPRGEKDAPRMGKWLQKHGLVPDLVVSSPAQRARATAELLVGKLHIRRKRIVFDDRIYEAGLRQLLDVIASRGADSDTLLLVGHNPGLEELLAHLASEPPPRDGRGKLMTTAAVAVLEFNGAIGTRPGSGRLQQLVRPRELKRAEPPEDAA
jgi:phosphohistidine phosphatase